MTERGAWRLLLALAALNVLGYVDRQLVAALAPVLMAELGLTRADVGLLIGPVFIVVYALGTLVLGAAADRGRRPRIVAGGLAAWSAATALTGAASSFATLALWRGLVGVGEATLPPTALSMLGRPLPALPPRLRERASTTRGSRSGSAAASPSPGGSSRASAGARASSCSAFSGSPRSGRSCGWPTRRGAPSLPARPTGNPPGGRGWRAACAARLPRSPRSRCSSRARPSSPTRAPPRSTSSPGSCRSAASSTRARPTGPRPSFSGRGSRAASAIGALTDAAHRRRAGGRLAAFVLLGAVSLAATAAFYLLPAASPWFLAAWLVAQAWTLGWFGPLLAAIHERAPAGAQATVIGFSLMALNLGGVGLGPWITGAIGDRSGLTAGLLTSVAVGAVGLVLVGLAAVRQRQGSVLKSVLGAPIRLTHESVLGSRLSRRTRWVAPAACGSSSSPTGWTTERGSA